MGKETYFCNIRGFSYSLGKNFEKYAKKQIQLYFDLRFVTN